jgi:hypothetical protein
MSLSYQKLRSVEVRDPRTILTNEREYAILRAGSQTTLKQFTTTSISSSSIQFSCPPPSGGVIVDRKMYLALPVRLTLAGTAPVGQVLLNAGQDAPRAFPLSSAIDTLQVTINNQSVSINMADVIQPLMHFNNDVKLSELDYSTTPSQLDQSQDYETLFGSVRSPFANFGDSTDQSMMSRGGFPFTIRSNTNTSAIVDMVICEPLFLSPFYWGHSNSSGFFNVNTMDFNITFLGNAGFRMWSHDALSSGVQTNITSIGVQFNGFSGPAFAYLDSIQPNMLFTYITPNETQVIPYNMPITYSYFDVQRYPTDLNQAIPANGITPLNSNNIQLNSIPRRMYIYVRQSNSELYSTCANPDSFFSIENVNIQFQNKTGLLNSANKRQLYEMSVKNHCNLSWTEWSGQKVNNANFSGQYAGIGSILAIEFASDIGLDSIEAPGKLGQYMLQVNVNVTNVSNRSITPTLYVVVVSEGSFTIEGLGKASTNIGVISSQDILDAASMPGLNYKDVEHVNGGNFLSGLKDFGRNLLSGIKDANAFLKDTRLLSNVSGLIPHPGAQAFSGVTKQLGYGEGEGEGEGYMRMRHKKHRGGVGVGGVGVGGVVIGGRQLPRSRLAKKVF